MSADTPLTVDAFPEATLEDWRRQVEERSGGTAENLGRTTGDGVELQALYTSVDRGEAPAVPGVGRSRTEGDWSVCARLDALEPLDLAAEIVAADASGADAIWLRLDRAARLGLEATDDESVEHLGVDGAVLHHATDLNVALEGAALGGASPGALSLWLDAGGNALPAVAQFLSVFERQGLGREDVELYCGADPLGALAADGRLPRDLMKLESEMAVLTRFSNAHLPGGRAITVSTLPYHRAGASVAEELAFAVATAGDYLAALEQSGLDAETSAGEIALRFGVGTDLFVEIAKLRAARWLWAMLLGACGIEQPPPPRIHAVGSERTFARLEVSNNLLRSTGQAFAAVCGGADVVTLLPFDVTLGETGERARRLSRTAQRVLADEAGLGRVVDPAAGSHYVESLSRQLVERAWAMAREISGAGGMREGLLSGRVGTMVAASAAARQREIDSGARVITSVTAFARPDEVPEPSGGREVEALRERARLSLAAHRRLGAVAESTPAISYSRDFVVDELVAAAGERSTLADLGGRLGGAEGAESIPPLPLRRDAAPFEPAPSALGEEE